MKPIIRKTISTLAVTLLGLGQGVAQAQSGAQAWPTSPIQVTVPSAAGTAPDIMMRLIGEKLAVQLGQPVIIENKPGAGGTIGVASLKRSSKKDHHFLFAPASVFALSPYLFPQDQGEIVGDLEPVALVAKSPMMIAVSASSPISSISDLIAAARKQPDFVISTTSQFTMPHLAADLLSRAAGIPVRAMPYSSSSMSIAAVVGGDAHAVIDGIPPLEGMVQGGRIRAIGVFSEGRLPDRDSTPAVLESVQSKDMVINGWFGLAAPKGTDPAAISKVSDALAKIVNEPEVQARFSSLGVYASPSTPAEFGEFWAAERARWLAALKGVGAPVLSQ